MFYDLYLKLCDNKGIKPSTASEEMGFSKATVSNWKARGNTPTDFFLRRISDYFDVDFDSLKKGQIQYMFDWPNEDGTVSRTPVGDPIDSFDIKEQDNDNGTDLIRQTAEFAAKFALLTDNHKKLISDLIDTFLEDKK